jgi:tetratricopeptide (TPR) repeat protein
MRLANQGMGMKMAAGYGFDSSTLHQKWFTAGVGLCLCLAVTLAGCSRGGVFSEAEAERSQGYAKAKKLSESKDYKDAAEAYRKVLLEYPEFAQAHLELGLIFDDKLNDPIAAIYHYREFLALKPHSDKRQLVNDFIERAKLSLAAKMPQSPVTDPGIVARIQAERNALAEENAELKARLTELDKIVASAQRPVMASPPLAVVNTTPPRPVPVAAAPVEPTGQLKTHVVQKGDTLQSLALRYYGNRSAWEKIYQANRSGMPTKDTLKIGQELVIP